MCVDKRKFFTPYGLLELGKQKPTKMGRLFVFTNGLPYCNISDVSDTDECHPMLQTITSVKGAKLQLHVYTSCNLFGLAVDFAVH